MKLYRLLNSPYISTHNYPVPQLRLCPKKTIKPYEVFYTTFFDAYYEGHTGPFSLNNKVIKTQEELQDLFFEHMEELEKDLLDDLFFVVFNSYKAKNPGDSYLDTYKKFKPLTIAQKCEHLNISVHLLDRELLDLIHYYELLTYVNEEEKKESNAILLRKE